MRDPYHGPRDQLPCPALDPRGLPRRTTRLRGSSSRARGRSTAAPTYLPVDERHPIHPVDVNGINKTAGEWYHLVYGQVYGIPVCVLRLTNTYGPRMRVRDARQTFLGFWLRQILLGEELLVFGDGRQRRDFNYVDDAVRALLLAATRDEAVGQIYNLGDDEVLSLLRARGAARARERLGLVPRRSVPRRPQGDRHRRLLQRLRQDPGRPRVGAGCPSRAGPRALARVLPRARGGLLGAVTRVPFLDLARHVAAIREEIDEAIADVLDGGWFVLGAHVASVRGGVRGIVWSSRTRSAWHPGRTRSPSPSAQSVSARATRCHGRQHVRSDGRGNRGSRGDRGARRRDPDTWTLDPESFAGAVTSRTKAVVPVHLYGRCADMDAIGEIARARASRWSKTARRRTAPTWGGGRPGSIGDAAAFSFYPTKNLGALGDGGAVVTNDDEIASRLRRLRVYGENERYSSIETGWNSRLDSMQAAVLRAQALAPRRLERAAARDRRHVPRGTDRHASERAANGRRSRLSPLCRRIGAAGRSATRLADRGVETLVHYPRAVHEHPAYAHLARPGKLDTSERLCRRVLSLPLYPELTTDEAAAVIGAVRSVVRALNRQ